MKHKTIQKIYSTIGHSLCTCAGGIVGFVIGGPILAVPGVLAGLFGGKFLDQCLSSQSAR